MRFDADVVIAGAGIGGLTAAASLLQAGYSVRVLEQAPALGEVGAGIQTSANASRVLHSLGLADQLERIGVKPERYRVSLFNTNETLNEFRLAAAHEEQFGYPYYLFHRADLHDILARHVQQLDANCIALNARVSGFEQDADSATAILADGSTLRGKMLVGADGIKSAVREQLIGRAPATFTGDVAWRCTVPAERMRPDYMDQIVNIWAGPGAHLVVYYISGGKTINYIACCEEGEWSEESWTLKAPWSELKQKFTGWHDDVQELLDATDRDECYKWALNNRTPTDIWSDGRVTLLGDAIHPTLPYMAQGAAMAIEDAAVLRRCIDQNQDIATALRVYQNSRKSRTARIVTQSTQHGHLYHLSSAEEFHQAFKGRDLGADRASWLFSYDPLTAALEL
jgi:salicylate hydroxylase